MTRATQLLAAAILAAGATACKPPLHMTYDFGRAYIETLRLQADLTRPSVANSSYMLYGREGVSIRLNVQSETQEESAGEFRIESE